MDKNFYKNFIITTVIAAGILSFLGNEYYKKEASLIIKTASEDQEAKLLRHRIKKRIKNKDYTNDYTTVGMLREIDNMGSEDFGKDFKDVDADLNNL